MLWELYSLFQKNMIKLKRIFKRSITAPEKVIFLLIVYLILRDAFSSIPYINLITKDIGSRIAITWILALFMFRPSPSKLLISSIVAFAIFLLLRLIGNTGDYGLGMVVMISLVVLAMKYPKTNE